MAVLTNIEDNKYTIVVFLDLSKASTQLIDHKTPGIKLFFKSLSIVIVAYLCYHGSIVTYLAGSTMFCSMKLRLL